MQAHLATEKYLTTATSPESDKKITFTAIREGIYSESFPMYTGFFNLKEPQRKVKIPHDGSGPGIAWAKIDDLGEATARLIKKYVDSPQTFEYRDRVVLLSGPKAWSIADTLKVAAKAVWKEVSIEQVGVEEYVNEPLVIDQLGSHGPEEVPRQWATSFEAVRHGETAVVSTELGKLLGREPEGFGQTVENLAKG